MTLQHVASWIGERLDVGRRVLVHCRADADAGRSATVVCPVLMGMGRLMEILMKVTVAGAIVLRTPRR